MHSQAFTSNADRELNTEQCSDAPDIHLLTTAQVGGVLGVPVVTLERWRRRRIGPPWVRIGPRAVRYDPVELTAWLERNRPSQVSA